MKTVHLWRLWLCQCDFGRMGFWVVTDVLVVTSVFVLGPGIISLSQESKFYPPYALWLVQSVCPMACLLRGRGGRQLSLYPQCFAACSFCGCETNTLTQAAPVEWLTSHYVNESVRSTGSVCACVAPLTNVVAVVQ